MIRLSVLDLWRSRRALVLTLLTLCLGFSALLLSLGLKDSQELLVTSKAREILSGDFQVTGTRPLEPSEREELQRVFRPSRLSPETDVLATLRTTDRATLVELKAVTPTYPLVGQVQLGERGATSFESLVAGSVWLADELRTVLNLKAGDRVRIGESQFVIAAWISADVALRRGATGFAPRAYIRQDDLAATNLIQPGSQVQYRLTGLLSAPRDVTKLTQELNNWPEDLIVRSPSDAIEGIKRGVTFVARYLGLITLFLMLLGFVSGFYLLQIHLRSRALTYALCLLYGARPRRVEGSAGGQVVFLLLLAWVISLGLVHLGFSLLNPMLESILPPGAMLFLGPKSFLVSGTVVLLSAFIFILPFAARLRKLEPQVLLEHATPDLPMAARRVDLAPYALAFLTYVILTA